MKPTHFVKLMASLPIFVNVLATQKLSGLHIANLADHEILVKPQIVWEAVLQICIEFLSTHTKSSIHRQFSFALRAINVFLFLISGSLAYAKQINNTHLR